MKVLDLMWAVAGPTASRVLADYGATVVRVETAARPDVCRTIPPWQGGPVGVDNSVLFHNTNAGKRMLTLDLSQPMGRAVLMDLVRWADVVAEAFSPKVMRGWGLDYDTLRLEKPDLIMLSTCLMGQSGPLAEFAGYGNLAAAITGFYDLCGWPDRPPAGPWGAYTDYVSPRFNAVAVLAALEYRRRTGLGQHIDLAQAEAALQFLAPALLDYTVNGRVPNRVGNRDAGMAPHGVYPSAGNDCWVAIAVDTDAQWRALCAVLDQPALADDPRLARGDGRRAHADEIDAVVAAWTAVRTMYEAEAALQGAGVPASAVQGSAELWTDPQLAHRGHFVPLAHPEHGTTIVEGSRTCLSHTPAHIGGTVPTRGRDNQYVLQELLGYDDDRITALVVAGVLQ